jgi:hypothetical protein
MASVPRKTPGWHDLDALERGEEGDGSKQCFDVLR